MQNTVEKKVSFKSMLLRSFVMVAVIPIIAIGLFSVFNILTTLQRNTDNLMDVNLQQIDRNINITLDAYEDLAYQIYTDDNVVKWVQSIDAGVDEAASVSSLRRYMNGLLNTKDYIRAISVVTEGGSVITYDTMTKISVESAWMQNYSVSVHDMYDEVTADYRTHMFPTEYATTFANEDYYLFHIAHRIVNYKKLTARIGMVIVSLDEELLKDIYAPEDGQTDRCGYIINENGRILSNMDKKDTIGTYVNVHLTSDGAQKREYIEKSALAGKGSSVYRLADEQLGWTILTVFNDSSTRWMIILQGLLVAGIAAALLIMSIILSVRITRRLNKDIALAAEGMERAQEGDLSTEIEIRPEMPEEIETMASAYNVMIEKMRIADENEKAANAKQQQAQIAALEAQINPHFLYNTLDTINWMAIEKNEYDISNAINTLATILRYAIAKSNVMVTVKDEIEWLKKYIFLQQFRLKDKFKCELDVDPDVLAAPIYKLLMQPFIENAIIHGFTDETKDATIWVSLHKVENDILITIRDNGKGMEAESVEQINHKKIEARDRTHIGMGNVITRMEMYYGDRAYVRADSKIGEGTTITLRVPYITDGIV